MMRKYMSLLWYAVAVGEYWEHDYEVSGCFYLSVAVATAWHIAEQFFRKEK